MASFEGAPIPILVGVRGVNSGRKAWLCDVWGVLHDGVTAFPSAIDACRRFKNGGGKVVLISNSPKPSFAVAEHLRSLKVPDDCFDALVTSGDAARMLLAARCEPSVFHIGPERDAGFFDGLDVKLGPAGEATLIVCTGFFDEEHETAEDYNEMFSAFAARGVPMLCANPDLVVERGTRLLPCAGALAERYAALGQAVIQAGKPFQPIYELALGQLAADVSLAEVLAIGDGIDTDIKGACLQGIDAIYVASHVHLGNTATRSLTGDTLATLFQNRPFRPIAAMSRLGW
ncbi:MAG: TIGR01459 family HAD-type hydrolase [Rhodomicrobium sp.]